MPVSPGNNLTLNWTNVGLKPAIVVAPGLTDTSSSSLELVGQGAPNWAIPIQENFLKLLENFASNGSPPNPTLGQLWYDSSNEKLFVCIDPGGPSEWKEIISNPNVFVNTVSPEPADLGFIWYNPLNLQLSVCIQATIISPATPAVWAKVLTFDSIISSVEPALPRINGQLWFDTVNRVLFAWNSVSLVWERVGPTKDIDVIGGSGWNDVIPWLNKILSTPTNTLNNADPFTENNAWGFNQTVPFGPYYSDVPSAEWERLYDTVLGLGTLLGISTAGLVKQDFHLPGNYDNQYGIPFMLTQWDLIIAKLEEFKNSRLTIAGPSLEFSNAIISFVGTAGAGSILSVSSTPSSGFPSSETWTLVATSSTNFTVTGSTSGAQAAATVGTPYDNGIIAFTINAGVNPFVASDTFTISVLPNLKSTYNIAWGAGATGINNTFTMAFNDINHQRGFFNASGKLKFNLSFDDTTTTRNQFWNQFLTAVDHFAFDKGSTIWGSPVEAEDSARLGYYDLTTSYQTILYVDSRILPSGAIRSLGYAAPFTASAVTTGVSNIGNGTVGAITVVDQNPLTTICETWTLTAINATTFAVVGSTSGAMSNLTVGAAYSNAHIGLTITAGGTAFVEGDTFTFSIAGIMNYLKVEAKIDVNPNNLLFKITLNDTGTAAPDSVTTTGANKGTIAQLHMIKANGLFLNNPEIPYPTVTNTGWTP